MVDRLKNMIISSVEDIYRPEAAEVAVMGVPGPHWAETVKAVVVRASGSTVAATHIIAYCRRLAHCQCPTSMHFVDGLTRNATGKILKRDLREPYWRGHGRNI